MGYKVFHGSTLVTAFAVTHWRSNGRTRQTISDPQLRSGILSGRGTEAFHQAAPSLGIFPKRHVFITAFITVNLAQRTDFVNGLADKLLFTVETIVGRGLLPPAILQTKWHRRRHKAFSWRRRCPRRGRMRWSAQQHQHKTPHQSPLVTASPQGEALGAATPEA